MPTECSAKSFGFARVESRAVVAAFDGGAVPRSMNGSVSSAWQWRHFIVLCGPP